MLLTIADIVRDCVGLLPNCVFLESFKFYAPILNELFQRVEHQVVEAVLSMIEGGQSEDRLGVLRKSLLPNAETGNETGV
jgi:hypothetical protein